MPSSYECRLHGRGSCCGCSLDGHRNGPPPAPASPGLRFADRRTHALLSALLIFRLHPHGFTNKDLRTYTAELRGLNPDAGIGEGNPCDLLHRQLENPGLHPRRMEGTHRYQVTDHGLDTAKFLTCVQDHVLRCGLAELATATPTPPQVVCDPPPPHTAPRSKTSPQQHNSRNETSSTAT